ncbi:MAG: hypothetical protein M1832_000100 [Thelocarpon impressellum]|nr:MAG: hypothetical protein M1832_000100 [Thelocarpon impressellum]
MHSHLAQRLQKSAPLPAAVPPPHTSGDYSPTLAGLAAHILYCSPLLSQRQLPIFILNAAAFPDANEVDFDGLLPYVLARLPGEEELIGGKGYEVIFFAGAGVDGAGTVKKGRPGWGWFVQAYKVLTRATRKRLQALYIVHERSWVRILVEMLSTIVSPKSRKKILHCSTLTALAFHVPIEDLLIPPSAYLQDRRLVPEIHAPYATGQRAFGAVPALPGSPWRLPRVLRETTTFILMGDNIKIEGIFRIPPLSTLLDALREAYDRGQKFILWKEGDVVLPQRRHGGEHPLGLSHEGDHDDGYGVYLAAGLIKLWYSKLREPIFPPSTYKQFRTDGKDHLGLERLVDLLSVESRWSLLPLTSRTILTRHLLPLLAMVAEKREHNRMNASNLATCIAPSLVRGPDPMEDVKMTAAVAKIMEAAVQRWDGELRQACRVEADAFQAALEHPPRDEDYEDPLPDGRRNAAIPGPSDQFEQADSLFVGIATQGNEGSGRESEKPPLPPRPPPAPISSAVPAAAAGVAALGIPMPGPVRRKPAPVLAPPPRYSVITAKDPGDPIQASPIDYANTTDEFGSSTADDTKTSTNHVKPRTDEGAQPDLLSRVPLTTQQVDRDSHTAGRGERIVRRALPSTSSESSVPADLAKGQGEGGPQLCNQGSAEFAKVSWPASSTTLRTSKPTPTPNILNLAKPIQPTPRLPTPRQSSLPFPSYPKTRTPSPGLAQRFPQAAGHVAQRSLSDIGAGVARVRDRLGDARVGDLKRLYEERALMVNELAAAALEEDRKGRAR